MRFFHELPPQVLSAPFAAGVLGNIVAAVICGTPALWHLHRKLDRQHADRLAQAAVHHAMQMTAIRATATAGEQTERLLADVKTAARRRPVKEA